MFSKACEYGIRATIYIATQSYEHKRVSLKDIAKKIGSPEAFTAKILQQLVRSNIIDSVKGPSGGFDIEVKKLHKINLGQVVTSIDGDALFTECGLGLKECSSLKPCPVHDQFKKIREDLKEMLGNTNLYDLSLGQKEGLSFLKQ